MHRLHRTSHLSPATVWFAPNALQDVAEEAARSSNLETGGMLLGYVSPGSDETLVERVLGPGPDAEHHPHSFVPDSAWQQHHLAAIYATSGRITTYLGDWHTHPLGSTTPSRRDHKTARAVARSKGARTSIPLTLILASDKDGEWTANCYRFENGRLRLATLRFLAEG